MVSKNESIFILGPFDVVQYNIDSKKITLQKTNNYNLSPYGGTVSSDSGNVIIPPYEEWPSAITNIVTDPRTINLRGISSKYSLVKIDSMEGFEIGQKMNVKMATIIDDKRHRIYLAEPFSAADISQQGILALGDWLGNIFIYNPLKKTVVEKIESTTSIIQYATISNNGKLIAQSEGNSRSNLIKIINRESGKILFEQEETKPDISRMNFSKGDSSLFVFYPDGSIDEIIIGKDRAVKQNISQSIIKELNRDFYIYNYNIGAGQLSSIQEEEDFIKTTNEEDAYELMGTKGLKMLLLRDSQFSRQGLPSAQLVNLIIEQFGLTNETGFLYDQFEKDLFVLYAKNHNKTRFMAIVDRLKIDSIKANYLYDFLADTHFDKISILEDGIPKPLTVSLVERPRKIMVDKEKRILYVFGEQNLIAYSLTEPFNMRVLKFRIKDDLSNYVLNIKHNLFLVLNANKVMLFDLEKMLHKYSYYSYKGSNLFQSAEGYYYTTNRTPQMAFKYQNKIFPFSQFDVKYNRPDKVLEAIGNMDTALIHSYKKAYEKRIKKLGIDTTSFGEGYSVPEMDFVNRDAIEYEQKDGQLSIHLNGQDSTYKLDRFNIWVNEIPLYGQKGISLRKRNKNSIDTTINIQLTSGENRIETSILNVNGTESYRMPLYVKYTPQIQEKKKVYFMGFGVEKFSNPTYNLLYSVKDVRQLAKKMRERYGDTLEIDTLFNEKVTEKSIAALKQKLFKTNVNDKVIVAYSGHGLLSKEYDYYLGTSNVDFEHPENGGLPYEALENLLDSIPARQKLMLIDACHSGEVDKDEKLQMAAEAKGLGLKSKGVTVENTDSSKATVGLQNSFELMQNLFVNVGKGTGATIISASAGTQFALENGDLENGVFTYSILEAMNSNSSLTVSQLKAIVGKRVVELTNGMQKPTSRNETINSDWRVW